MKELRLIKVLRALLIDGSQVVIYDSNGEKINTINIPKGANYEQILKKAGFILIP